MKLFGINLIGNSPDADGPDLSKQSTIPDPPENMPEPSAKIPACDSVESQLRDQFNQSPGLESMWKAIVISRVQRFLEYPFNFEKEYIDQAEYRRYRKFYQTYILEMEKPVLDECMNLDLSNTSFGHIVGFVAKARDYGDREFLKTIFFHAERLFTEPQFADDLLNLKDQIEGYREEMDERDAFIAEVKLAATKGSRSQKQVVLEKLRCLMGWQPAAEVELAMCRSYIHTYKSTDNTLHSNRSEIEWAWARMIELVARWEGEKQGSALADQLEKRNDVYTRPDEARKELREIRANIRNIQVGKEKYNTSRSVDNFKEEELLSDLHLAVVDSKRFPKANSFLKKLRKREAWE